MKNIKIIIAVIALSICMCLTLVSCNTDENKNEDTTVTTEVTTETVTEVTTEVTTAEDTSAEETTTVEVTTAEETSAEETTTVEITTAEETSLEETTTVEVTTAEETSLEETTTVEVTTAEETSLEETTTVEVTTAEETSLEETTTVEITTAEDTSAEETTTVEVTTAEETSVEETSVEETTVEETSVEETSAEETSVEETSVEETTVEETTEFRFNYFEANLNDYASIDPSVYESFTMVVGSEYEVNEEAISAYIESLCYEYRYELNGTTKVTNQPIQKGDIAYIFYKGVIDGEEFEGGSNMDATSPYALTIGSGAFIYGFEDALIGIVPNETSLENMIAINLTFPENYYEELAGKDVTFYVYISWIVEYEIPEFNESFVRDTLKYESESEDIVAAFLEDVRIYLEAQNASQIQAMRENHIWTTLIEGMSVTKYPEGEVESYYNYYYSEVEYYYEYYTYFGYKFESFDAFARQFLGLSADADWLAEITKYAEEATKQTMAYHIVAENEGIEITEDDVNAEIDAYIEYYKNYYGQTYTREQIIEGMGELSLRESALCTKVLGVLEERVTIIYE